MVKAVDIEIGFKRTEKGLIPEDWRIMELGKIASVTKLAGYEYTKNFNSYKDTGEIIVLRGTNLTNNKLDLSDVKTIPRLVSENLLRSKLNVDDLVFAYVGTIGPVYLVDENDKFHLGPNTSKITCGDSIDAQFLYSYFKSWLIKSEIFEHTSIGAQPSLSMAKIRKFKIIVPRTKEEQATIASALNDADKQIIELGKLILKKKNIKQGAIQELLRPKEGWREISILEIVEKNNGIKIGPFGSALKKEILCKIGYKVYGQENVFERDMSIGARFVNKERFQKLKSCELLYGDFIVSMMGTIGKCMIVPKMFEPGIMDSHLIRLRLNSEIIDSDYLRHFFSSQTLLGQVKKLSVGGIMEGLSSKIIKQITVPIPPELDQQTAIAENLSDMDAEIEKLEYKLEKHKKIKEGMMQNLLTGKIRLV